MDQQTILFALAAVPHFMEAVTVSDPELLSLAFGKPLYSIGIMLAAGMKFARSGLSFGLLWSLLSWFYVGWQLKAKD